MSNNLGEWVQTPRNKDQAELMVEVGTSWLQRNAPGIQKTPDPNPELAKARKNFGVDYQSRNWAFSKDGHCAGCGHYKRLLPEPGDPSMEFCPDCFTDGDLNNWKRYAEYLEALLRAE